MKVTDTKIQDTVKEVIGEDSLAIIKFLKDKKNVSDFKIAEKVDRDIHEVRNILYRLLNHNLVTYYRKKDRQKGWYISYWTFEKHKIKELITKSNKEKLAKYSVRLKEEMSNVGNFYMCPNACVRVGFERAVDLEYRCPECGNILNHQDNAKTIDFLKTKIQELEVTGKALRN
jgi:transcription initiation factor TFIIE subunit alpha